MEHRAPAERLESLRAIVGELMARSKREIPHHHLQREIDLTAALAWLEARNGARAPPERILPAALLLRAVSGISTPERSAIAATRLKTSSEVADLATVDAFAQRIAV